jgi:DNA-binding NarL/FixJ family response regulator
MRLLRHVTATGTQGTGKSTTPLSERETEVVRAIARGCSNREIAAELFISLSTVKSHLSAIQAKLGVRNRVGIAAWAWENRLADPSWPQNLSPPVRP